MSLPRPSVLFVCVHNAGRSQMAQGWLTALAGDRVEVRSAGSEPAGQINPGAVHAMAEVGVDIRSQTPTILTTTAVQDSDVVITMGCGDACLVFPGKHYEDWDLTDPAGLTVEAIRPIRDEIRRHVEVLLDGLLTGPDDVAPAPRVEPMTEQHWPDVRRIYAAGIATGDATFETEPPEWTGWDATHLAAHRFVSLDDRGAVTGWVAVSPVSDRCAYAGVVEHSVYVDPPAHGLGVGSLLLRSVIRSTEAAGIWTIQSGVFPENLASLALHARHGFRTIGTRERIGRQDGRWRDVVLLERRSPLID
jgi:L-amino acid N-acyltransferase YncA/protein-tyrosine-phosphatase